MAIDRIEAKLKANPIRKVVNMLQGMAAKVEEEGEKEKEIYDKFMCYCQTNKKDLEKSIKDNSGKNPNIQADLEEAQSTVAKLKEELKSHRSAVEAANKAMEEATGVRENEKKKFDAESSEKQGFLDSLAPAMEAVKRGMAGKEGFLQTDSQLAATVKRAATADSMLTDDDRDSVISFLTLGANATDEYAPAGGEVVGIMANMKADYEKDVADLTSTENEAVQLYEELIEAKKREVKTLMVSIQKKTERVGDLSVKVVNLKHDFKESGSMLEADQNMLANLNKDCDEKTASNDARVKNMHDELVCIGDTIKILNSDDALDVFKASLPAAGGSALLQISSNTKVLARLQNARDAAKVLKEQPSNPEFSFLEAALLGKKVDFSKVTKMIDNMLKAMDKEQDADDEKKKYCVHELHAAKVKATDIAKDIEEQEANADDRAETLQAIHDDLKAMEDAVAELDKVTKEATEERKSQNEEYSQIMSEKTAAKEILEFAMKRMQKFYSPEVEEEKKEALLEKKGEVAKAAAAKDQFPEAASPLEQLPGSEGTLSKGAFFKALDARRPTSFLQTNQKEKGNKVVELLVEMIHELTIEMTMIEKDEEHDQAAYEGLMEDSKHKRETYAESIQVKQNEHAENEELKSKETRALKASGESLVAAKGSLQDLHQDCDWMLENFDLRRQARSDEADSLKKAKAVLHGAGFSLVQSHTSLRGA